MAERTQTERPLGDLGRRLAARRAQLGLSRRETAARTGMAPSYPKHLEEHPGAAPNRGALLSLAAALETTVSELTGGATDLPPGLEQAARTPEFTAGAPGSAPSCRGGRGALHPGRVTGAAPGVEVESQTVRAAPGHALVEATRDAAVVVIGSHRPRHLGRLAPVAPALLDRSYCPVIVVPCE